MLKRKLVLMVLLAAIVLVSAAQALVSDPMTQGYILDPSRDSSIGPGRWHDERDQVWPPVDSALKESSFSHDGDGSMMIDYGYWAGQGNAPAGDPYDREPRGYFANEGTYTPALPDLTGLSFTFWWYKGDMSGPEHIRELQLFSPDGMARFAVANGGEGVVGDPHYTGATGGWQFVQTALVGSDGWIYESFGGDGFDPAAVDAIDFWVSAWHQDWAEIPPGSGNWEPIEEQVIPTGQPIYIDDLQLIPEPATMSLLGLGMFALLKRRKA